MHVDQRMATQRTGSTAGVGTAYCERGIKSVKRWLGNGRMEDQRGQALVYLGRLEEFASG
jgi:hypothetical protein